MRKCNNKSNKGKMMERNVWKGRKIRKGKKEMMKRQIMEGTVKEKMMG